MLEALTQAERVLGFSASVRVARWPASSAHLENPVSSHFVNPSGTALVALHEGADRQGRDGVVEIACYTLLMAEDLLHAHLATAGQVQIGSCRDLSVTNPQSRMALFAGLAAEDVEAAPCSTGRTAPASSGTTSRLAGRSRTPSSRASTPGSGMNVFCSRGVFVKRAAARVPSWGHASVRGRPQGRAEWCGRR